MNASYLSIALPRPDDGDEHVIRYVIEAQNERFWIRTQIWSTPWQIKSLSSALGAYPAEEGRNCEFTLGSERAGLCKLTMSAFNQSGHIRLLVCGEVEEEYPGEKELQHACLALTIEPAALDVFRINLMSLASRDAEEALILGTERF